VTPNRGENVAAAANAEDRSEPAVRYGVTRAAYAEVEVETTARRDPLDCDRRWRERLGGPNAAALEPPSFFGSDIVAR